MELNKWIHKFFEKIYKGDNFKKLWKFADRLIATVDYWRGEWQQRAKDAVSLIDRLQEENTELKQEIEILIGELKEARNHVV